jgi:hypothetical protein
MKMAVVVMTPPTLVQRERHHFIAAFLDALLLLWLVFQNNVCFQTQTHCGMDLKGFKFGLCLSRACHNKRHSKSALLPHLTKPPDLMVESWQHVNVAG